MIGRAEQPARFLFISQVYIPDPASVGQHLADAAARLVQRGHEVTVMTASRGYDDPSRRYPRRERIHGVDIRRFPLSSFGKESIVTRLIGAFFFLTQAIWHALFIGKIQCVVVSTSPPMASLAAIAIAAMKGTRLKFWVMDLNPDQMIALGRISAASVPARVFEALNRWILRAADDVIVLDRFMAERVMKKLDVSGKLHVLPPWPLEEVSDPIPHEINPWRRGQGLGDELVVMYSGNHGPSNPIATVLRAAEVLSGEDGVAFLFVGGGTGKKEVEASTGRTVRSLPYQPLSELRYSLSSADLHVVTMGDELVGIVHPCKIYGAMAVGRPVLAVGPERSHIGDLIEAEGIGWQVRQGDVEATVRILRSLLGADRGELERRGHRARAVVRSRLSRDFLCGALCDILERGVTS